MWRKPRLCLAAGPSKGIVGGGQTEPLQYLWPWTNWCQFSGICLVITTRLLKDVYMNIQRWPYADEACQENKLFLTTTSIHLTTWMLPKICFLVSFLKGKRGFLVTLKRDYAVELLCVGVQVTFCLCSEEWLVSESVSLVCSKSILSAVMQESTFLRQKKLFHMDVTGNQTCDWLHNIKWLLWIWAYYSSNFNSENMQRPSYDGVTCNPLTWFRTDGVIAHLSRSHGSLTMMMVWYSLNACFPTYIT